MLPKKDKKKKYIKIKNKIVKSGELTARVFKKKQVSDSLGRVNRPQNLYTTITIITITYTVD